MSAAPDEAARLEAFRAAHPRVVILTEGRIPVAYPGGMPVSAATVRELLDRLDALLSYPAREEL